MSTSQDSIRRLKRECACPRTLSCYKTNSSSTWEATGGVSGAGILVESKGGGVGTGGE